MSTFIIVTIICCCTIIICRLISTISFHLALGAEKRLYSTGDYKTKRKLTKSPYSLRRTKSNNGIWGYSICHKGKLLTSDGYYQILEINEAIHLMNELEAVGSYEKTIF